AETLLAKGRDPVRPGLALWQSPLAPDFLRWSPRAPGNWATAERRPPAGKVLVAPGTCAGSSALLRETQAAFTFGRTAAGLPRSKLGRTRRGRRRVQRGAFGRARPRRAGRGRAPLARARWRAR